MIIQTIIVTLLLTGGLVGFEYLARQTSISQTLIRKLIHVGMGLLVVCLQFVVDYHLFAWSGIFFTLLFIIARKYYRFHSLRDRHDQSWGEIYFASGIGVVAFFAPNSMIFVVSILIMALGDTIAFVVGKAYPRALTIRPGRNVAGSGANLVVTLGILLAAGVHPIPALVTTAVVVAAEVLSVRGLDNFTMPVTATLVLLLFS